MVSLQNVYPYELSDLSIGQKNLTFAAIKKCDRSLDHVKALSHLLHLNGFSPECVVMWLVSLYCWAKDISHLLHWKGITLV